MHVQQKRTLFMGDSPSFFSNKELSKNSATFSFLNWRMPGIHSGSAYRAQKAKQASQIVRDSFIHALETE
jgi:hypothetical protein